MSYPVYDFSQVDLDYSAVNDTVDDMFSDLRSRNGCGCKCGSNSLKILNQASILKTAIAIDLSKNDLPRYKDGTELVYKLLYNALPS